MSSLSVVGKCLLFAYHFEVQSRLTARRKPIGLIFWPMNYPWLTLLAVTDGYVDVTGLLENDVTAALGTGGDPAQAFRLVDTDRPHLQLVDVGAVIVLGVGDRRLEHALDDLGALLRTECQHVECLVDGQAADLVGHQPALLGRQAHAAQDRFGLHGYLPTSSAASSARPLSCPPSEP